MFLDQDDGDGVEMMASVSGVMVFRQSRWSCISFISVRLSARHLNSFRGSHRLELSLY